MAKLNRTCVNCQRKYPYCPSCSSDLNKPAWMSIFCSANCKDLFTAATDYFANELNEEQAKEIIDKADISNKQNFNKGVQKFIDKINKFFKSKKPYTPAITKESSKAITDDSVVIEDTIISLTDFQEDEQKTKTKKENENASSYKKNRRRRNRFFKGLDKESDQNNSEEK